VGLLGANSVGSASYLSLNWRLLAIIWRVLGGEGEPGAETDERYGDGPGRHYTPRVTAHPYWQRGAVHDTMKAAMSLMSTITLTGKEYRRVGSTAMLDAGDFSE
jgi:hypothetical protein